MWQIFLPGHPGQANGPWKCREQILASGHLIYIIFFHLSLPFHLIINTTAQSAQWLSSCITITIKKHWDNRQNRNTLFHHLILHFIFWSMARVFRNTLSGTVLITPSLWPPLSSRPWPLSSRSPGGSSSASARPPPPGWGAAPGGRTSPHTPSLASGAPGSQGASVPWSGGSSAGGAERNWNGPRYEFTGIIPLLTSLMCP